ncbi:O-methyl transferase family protein [Pseudomonas fluorescens]|jgi:hypothetical protein|uniref:O-methyl transferase family protein n=1 Tax=Pseudomonas fluorescens TaxID=294 RepID=A0A379IF42_PSEFL|nr:O-methyl transferase family protein [Pseudomonas fluorescens]
MLQAESTEHDDGSVAKTRILTDTFVPTIRAGDMTPGSTTWGGVLTTGVVACVGGGQA